MRPDYPMTPKRMLIRKLASFSNKMKRLRRMPVGDLSGSQLLLLPIIYSFDNPPTLNELAEANESSYQNTRQILEKLESTGYVTILPDEKDSRAIRAVLADKGIAAVHEYYRTMYGAVLHLYDGIDDRDVEITLRVLDTLYDRIDSLHVSGIAAQSNS